MFEVKKDYPFYLSIKTLRFSGMFFDDSAKFAPYLILAVVVPYNILFANLSPILHLIVMTKKHVGINLSEDVSICTGNAGMGLVFYRMAVYHRRWLPFFDKLMHFRELGKPPTFDAVVNKCRLIEAFFNIYVVFGGSAYCAVATLDKSCKELQAQTDVNLFCGFTIAWFPFDLDMRVVNLSHLLNIVTMLLPAAQTYTIIFESVQIVASHLRHLRNSVLYVFKEKDLALRSAKLRACVRYHIRIMRLAKDLNILMKMFCGHMSVVWAVSMGCTGYQILQMVKPFAAMFYFMGFFIAISFLIYAGQTLTSENENVGEQVYNSEWYLGTIEEQRCILLMIRLVQKPLELSAAPFGSYQRSMYVVVAKAAYSYITLLQQTL